MAHEPSMSNSCEICGGSWSMRVCLILLKIKLEPLQNKNQAAIQWPGLRIHDSRYNMVNPISSFTTLLWTHSKTTSSFARDKHPQATNGLIIPISDNDIHAPKKPAIRRKHTEKQLIHTETILKVTDNVSQLGISPWNFKISQLSQDGKIHGIYQILNDKYWYLSNVGFYHKISDGSDGTSDEY